MQEQAFVYVGAYTGFGPNQRGKAEGVDVFRLNPANGALRRVQTLAGVENPSYLVVDPAQRFLYAVHGSPHPAGAVSAFRIDPATGRLTLINRQPTTGTGPCHATIDRAGRYVLATSYHAGNVSVFPVRPDGGLAPASDLIQHHGSSVHPRQNVPHAHSVNFDRAERFALVCDLGLDRVLVYRFDHEKGKLIANEPAGVSSAPGAGPRHLAFHPSGRYVFVINEINSTLDSFRYAPEQGTLQAMETVSTLPPGFTGESTAADVHVHPNGRFIYGSNRGHDSLVIYEFDEATERLRYVGHQSTEGRTPRNFTLDRSGTLLLAANQDTDTIVAFAVDPSTGRLTPTGAVAATPSPTCVRIA